jgi:hypothetical protein
MPDMIANWPSKYEVRNLVSVRIRFRFSHKTQISFHKSGRFALLSL